MSYGEFLLVFLVLPLAVCAVLFRMHLSVRLAIILGGVAVLALLYTGPWDEAIIRNGVWSYGSGRIVGLLIGHVPLEEYGFYVLQVGLTGVLAAAVQARVGRQ